MVWTYTAYILWKYAEEVKRGTELSFDDFVDFVFVDLGRKHRLFLHDGREDLYLDLKYLEDLGAIEIENDSNEKIKITNRDELRRIASIVEDFPRRGKVELLREYLYRIDDAIATVKQKSVPPTGR